MSRKKIKPDKEFLGRINDYNSLVEKISMVKESISGAEKINASQRKTELEQSLTTLNQIRKFREKELGLGDDVEFHISYDTDGDLRIDTSFKDLVLLDYYLQNGEFKKESGTYSYTPGRHLNPEINTRQHPLVCKYGRYNLESRKLRIKRERLYRGKGGESSYTYSSLSPAKASEYLSGLAEKCPKLKLTVLENASTRPNATNELQRARGSTEPEIFNTGRTSLDDEYIGLVRAYLEVDDKMAFAKKSQENAQKFDDRENADKYRSLSKELGERKAKLEKEVGLGNPVELTVEYDNESVRLVGTPRDFILANCYINKKLDPEAVTYESLVSQEVREGGFEKTSNYISGLIKDYKDQVRFIPKRIEGGR